MKWGKASLLFAKKDFVDGFWPLSPKTTDYEGPREKVSSSCRKQSHSFSVAFGVSQSKAGLARIFVNMVKAHHLAAADSLAIVLLPTWLMTVAIHSRSSVKLCGVVLPFRSEKWDNGDMQALSVLHWAGSPTPPRALPRVLKTPGHLDERRYLHPWTAFLL